jgi:hypothetical protein
MKLHRLFSVGALLFVLVFATGATASQHLLVQIHVQAAKHKDGPWSDTDPDVTIKSGKSKDLFLRVKNEAMSPHTASVDLTQTTSGQSAYHYKWFFGHENITSQVQGSGYDFNLKYHKTKRFRIHARVTDDSNQDCLEGYFNAGSDGSTLRGFRINGSSPCVF